MQQSNFAQSLQGQLQDLHHQLEASKQAHSGLQDELSVTRQEHAAMGAQLESHKRDIVAHSEQLSRALQERDDTKRRLDEVSFEAGAVGRVSEEREHLVRQLETLVRNFAP